jgi:glycerol-3-phosphate dehydrogenase subunit C
VSLKIKAIHIDETGLNHHLHKDTSFDSCTKCTVCTVYCPVAKVNPDFPGPKQAGPDGERLRLKDSSYYDDMLKHCTNCKRCETACPSGVRIGDIIAVARGKYGKRPVNPKLVRDFILCHTDLFGQLASPVAPLVNKITQLPLVKSAMHKTIGVHKSKSLPKYSHGTFRQWVKKHAPAQDQFTRQVSYYHGCYVNYNHPQLGKDLFKVLNAMGIGVQLLEKEKCCGVAMIANGFHDKAKRNAQFNVQQLEQAVNNVNGPILATSSTCALTLQQEYPHVLGVDNQSVVASTHYITRFLLSEFMSGNIPSLQSDKEVTVAYHTPCHLEKSGNAIFTIELLKMLPGVDLKVLDSDCCGSAGTYGFKRENYAMSMAIGKDLFHLINISDADIAVTDCETCKWQIEENTKLDSIHPVSLIAQLLV